MSPEISGRMRIVLQGNVQGVGLRPSVFRFARSLGVGGWVANSAEGAVIEVEGRLRSVHRFCRELPSHLPLQSSLREMRRERIPCRGEGGFSILESAPGASRTVSVPPDLALCGRCRRELFDPADRRHGYPFINCTDCGPRFTILRSLPYDRENTGMAGFMLCPDCRREYSDPADRRFHAEPLACPVCGPRLSLIEDGKKRAAGGEALRRSAAHLAAGKIVALKGLGGFHLACRADDAAAVAELRRRKERPHKAFAVMAADRPALLKFADPSPQELSLLESSLAPIVLVESRSPELLRSLSPGLDRLGMMLPYTPLHALLFQEGPEILVMTSGNRRDEPICRETEEALGTLAGIADAFLVHDRPIENRMDDSVLFLAGARPRVLRHARGTVPVPIPIRGGKKAPPILGVGAEIKSAFCILKEEEALLSQHLGDLSEPQALSFFEETLAKYISLLGAPPEAVAHDLHPDYLSTLWAKESGLPLVAVQHHHAHVAAVLAEQGLEGPAVGVAFDGTGLGGDGTLWGGEFLIVEGGRFRRAAHLASFPLPGGDRAVREIWRSAFGLLSQTLGTEEASGILPERFWGAREDLKKALQDKTLSPRTSSMGRLFDAVAYLLDLREETSYEGQAAMELEALAGRGGELEALVGHYRFGILRQGEETILDPAPLLKEILADKERGVPKETMATRFHAAVSQATADIVALLAKESSIRRVALAGGCFQNRILLEHSLRLIAARGLAVYANEKVPANDGGIALGQVWVAMHRLGEE